MLKNPIAIFSEAKTQKDISFLAFSLSMFLLPISINFSTFLFISALILKLAQVFLKTTPLFSSKALKYSAIIGLVFFTYIILDSLMQAGVKNTFKFFDSEYSKLALLFLTPLLLRNKNGNKFVFLCFFFGVLTTVAIAFVSSLLSLQVFDRDIFSNLFDIHHTYISMFLLVVINYLLINLSSQKINKAILILFSIIILASITTIYFLDSKASIIIFIILFVIHFSAELSKKKAPWFLAALISIFIMFMLFNNKINVDYQSAFGFRLQIWETSLNVFKNNVIFGNLNLPEKDLLNYHHFLNGEYYFMDSDLNCHNQYISILMRFGVFGFVIFTLLAFNIFKYKNAKTNKLLFREFLGFGLITLSIFFIEDILSRHHGILFFTFFYNYYLVAIEDA